MSRPRHSGEPAALDAIGEAAAALACHADPTVRRLAARLDHAREELAGDRSEVPLAVRNRHLRGAAGHFAHLAPAQRVREVEHVLGLYFRGQWRFDRTKTTNPHPPGSLRNLLWSALTAVPRPLRAKQLHRIVFGK